MERIFLFFVVLVLVDGFKHQQHHPKFPKSSEEDEHKVACGSAHDLLRDKIIEQSKCGEPKEVFVEISVAASYIRVSPSSVWVKRCVGLCDSPSCKCIPTKTRMESIPIRRYNVKTDKDSCYMHNIEVHESCSCCTTTEEDCSSPRVFNPRKCSCQCPNMEERRNCLKKRNQNMRWNRYKCTCEQKKRTSW